MSTETRFDFLGGDGMPIAATRWDPAGSPRAIVQIAHGLGEHIGRYRGIAAFLAGHGLVVAGNDHRGHGLTLCHGGARGAFGGGGFDALVADMLCLSEVLRGAYSAMPLVLLGHSMGSFAAQLYVQNAEARLAGLALSGSGALDRLAAELWTGALAPQDLVNAPFAPARTPADWLSRDETMVDAYIADPLCFGWLTPDAMGALLASAPRLADPARLRGIAPSLPVYLLSGSCDPIGQQLAGVELLARRYEAAGLRRVERRYYHGGRHEMLNETNREEVHADLLVWLEEVIALRQ